MFLDKFELGLSNHFTISHAHKVFVNFVSLKSEIISCLGSYFTDTKVCSDGIVVHVNRA